MQAAIADGDFFGSQFFTGVAEGKGGIAKACKNATRFILNDSPAGGGENASVVGFGLVGTQYLFICISYFVLVGIHEQNETPMPSKVIKALLTVTAWAERGIHVSGYGFTARYVEVSAHGVNGAAHAGACGQVLHCWYTHCHQGQAGGECGDKLQGGGTLLAGWFAKDIHISSSLLEIDVMHPACAAYANAQIYAEGIIRV